jgi:hypothetical protein
MTNHVDLNNNDISGKVTDENGNDAENIPIIVRHVEQDEIVVSRADGLKTDANGNYNISSDNVPNTYLPNESEAIEMLEIIAEFGDGSNPSQGESAYDSGGNARMYPIRYSLETKFPLVVDDFEDADLFEYTVVGADIFGIESTSPIEGSHSLATTTAGNGTGATNDLIMSNDDDGLNYYPQKGDVFSFFAYEPGGSNSVPHYGFGGDKNSVTGYAFGWFPTIPEIRIRRLDGQGNGADLASDGASVYGNYVDEAVEVEVEWHDGTGSKPDNTIVGRVYEVNSSLERVGQIGNDIQATDSNYSGQTGIFFTPGSGDPENGLFSDRYQIEGEV